MNTNKQANSICRRRLIEVAYQKKRGEQMSKTRTTRKVKPLEMLWKKEKWVLLHARITRCWNRRRRSGKCKMSRHRRCVKAIKLKFTGNFIPFFPIVLINSNTSVGGWLASWLWLAGGNKLKDCKNKRNCKRQQKVFQKIVDFWWLILRIKKKSKKTLPRNKRATMSTSND